MRNIFGGVLIITAISLGFFVSVVADKGIHIVMNSFESFKPNIAVFTRDSTELLIAKANTEINFSSKTYITKNNVDFPKVSAKSFIVADLDTGDIIASKKPDQVYGIASITKLMTAITSEDTYKDDDVVTVSQLALMTYGKQGNFKIGEEYEVKDMMYPLLLESSNDAAEVLARHENRTQFISSMNDKAEDLGLVYTKFSDASGLSPGNRSTVSDLFKLSQYIFENRSHLYDITKINSYSVKGKTWYNINRFKGDDNFLGGKNGYTDLANQTHLGLFRLPLEGDSGYRNIAIIVLQSNGAVRDTRDIISHLNKNVYYEEE
ncbi:MAG: D-alanyl-D-alanine carboxypeptidase (penicillin-binding protein 5/6) [Candidatus Paceibacteria bacterium]|jgi:D-alanyl-D-alanine carboxypeptidase (penicillin-binding protein 5/6)